MPKGTFKKLPFRDDITGKKYNRLLVISHNKTIRGMSYWNCVCDCGKPYVARMHQLKVGYTKECKSCVAKKANRKNQTGSKNISGYFVAQTRTNALRRGYEFNLTVEYLQDLLESQNFKCALSNEPIFIGYQDEGRTDPKLWTGSLDRIDSTIGYKEGNVQFVTKTINFMKQHYSQDEFIRQCKLVAQKNK